MLRRTSHMRGDTWSLHCSACGKCCNCAPAFSLPELFYHQNRFIGCLGIRRMKRPRPGDFLGHGDAMVAANDADCAAFEEIARAYLHSVPGPGESDYDILLATQGFDTPGLDRCAALGYDGRCTIHANRKPVGCRAVPLDPLVPDRLQHLVLAERQIDADFSGAGCIQHGTNSNSLPLIRNSVVVDKEAKSALAERRRNLLQDKRFWGNAVFQLLEPELFSQPASMARIPTEGFMIMSLAPVLIAIAEVSERCRLRCVEYLESQLALSDHVLRASSLDATDETSSAQLRAFTRTNMALWNSMQTGRVFGVHETRSTEQTAATEAWLELTPVATRSALAASG